LALSHQRRLVAGRVLREGSRAPYRAVDIAEGEKHSFRYELTSPEIADRFRIGTTLASIAHGYRLIRHRDEHRMVEELICPEV